MPEIRRSTVGPPKRLNGVVVYETVPRTALGHLTTAAIVSSGRHRRDHANDMGVPDNTVTNWCRRPKTLGQEHAQLLDRLGVPGGLVLKAVMRGSEETISSQLSRIWSA